MSDPFRAGNRRRRLLAFLDIGGRPDCVEGLVETEPWIDVARELVRLGDNRFESGAYEGIAMGLAACQSARIAAQERQMGRELLSKRHRKLIS